MMVEFDQLSGFSFRCREGCALCCYATPAVAPDERPALLQIAPEITFLPASEGFVRLPSRPSGGACIGLRDSRCTVRTARPFPCQTFPIGVHIGNRLQATLVLSCPGLDLSGLSRDQTASLNIEGLDAEITAVEREVQLRPISKWIAEARRRRERLAGRLRKLGIRLDERELRALETPRIRAVLDDRFRPKAPPASGEPLENLPLFYDGRYGRVAIASREGGYELTGLTEDGRGSTRIGVFPPVAEWGELDASGRRLIENYLRFVLARDHFLWAFFQELEYEPPRTPVADRLHDRLVEIGSTVVARAAVRQRLGGLLQSRLDEHAIDAGIRATDAEVMDAPTLGRVL